MTFQKVWDSLQNPNTTADNAEPEAAQIIRLMDSDNQILNSNDIPAMLAKVWAKSSRIKESP